jgi:hypothetical protein
VGTPRSFVLDGLKPMHLLLRQPSCVAPKCRGNRSRKATFPSHTARIAIRFSKRCSSVQIKGHGGYVLPRRKPKMRKGCITASA